MRKLIAGVLFACTLALLCGLCLLDAAGSAYNAGFLLGLARRAEGWGREASARYLYGQSLLFNPYDESARLALCELLTRAGQEDRATEVLEEGLALFPTAPGLTLRLAGLELEQGDLAGAAAVLDRAQGSYTGMHIGRMRPSIQCLPAPGKLAQPQAFRIVPQDGVTYYYTVDGSTPTLDSAQYTHPLPLIQGLTTIKMIALKKDGLPSRLYEYQYDLRGYQAPVMQEIDFAQAVRDYLREHPRPDPAPSGPDPGGLTP